MSLRKSGLQGASVLTTVDDTKMAFLILGVLANGISVMWLKLLLLLFFLNDLFNDLGREHCIQSLLFLLVFIRKLES